MYYGIVRQVVRRSFQSLSAGDYESVLKQFSPDIRFEFFGDHALGAKIRGIEASRAWFQRLFTIFPGLQLTPLDIKVSGVPWDTLVVTRFDVQAPLPNGELYRNLGLQIVRLRWGRVIEDTIYEDTHRLIAQLQHMQQAGLRAAAAQPMLG